MREIVSGLRLRGGVTGAPGVQAAARGRATPRRLDPVDSFQAQHGQGAERCLLDALAGLLQVLDGSAGRDRVP